MAESATPTTPTTKNLSVDDVPSNKHLAVEKRMSVEKRPVGEETAPRTIIQQKRFRAGHESFRLRMFQEQCGFEPVTLFRIRNTVQRLVVD
jgi:hypothetical protein